MSKKSSKANAEIGLDIEGYFLERNIKTTGVLRVLKNTISDEISELIEKQKSLVAIMNNILNAKA